jgi:hypothetical protein
VQVDGETHTLVLEKCPMDLAGLYTARAQNPSGQLSCNGRLKVIRKYSTHWFSCSLLTIRVVKTTTSLSVMLSLNTIPIRTKTFILLHVHRIYDFCLQLSRNPLSSASYQTLWCPRVGWLNLSARLLVYLCQKSHGKNFNPEYKLKICFEKKDCLYCPA